MRRWPPLSQELEPPGGMGPVVRVLSGVEGEYVLWGNKTQRSSLVAEREELVREPEVMTDETGTSPDQE